jgi:hypothetical protein
VKLNGTANRRISKGGFAPLNLFYKKIEYLPATFDIRFLKFLLSIKLGAIQTSRDADT